MVTVRLHGHLGERFGSEHEFAISTPAEAFLALEANYPGFRKAFLEAPAYYLRVDGDWLPDAMGMRLPASREIDLIPDVKGAVFVETAIASALVSTFAISATAASITASIIVAVVTTALMIGLSLLLAPKPKKDTKTDKNQDSFIFSGSDQTIGQGAPVPLIYGRCWVSPVVVSAGLETGDEAIEGASGGGGDNSPWSGRSD